MADVISAGTFIGAVLEQAGYMAQAKILTDFRSFFREAGALVYIMAVVGAVASFAIFGSFRAVRYLLLGPAIYWFLVGPTTDYGKVVWKIGGGVSKGMNDHAGDDASRQDIDKVLQASTLNYTGGAGGPIKVASGFALFAKVINDVTNDIVDVVLNDEDGDYLINFGKGRALDYLISAEASDAQLNDILEGNLGQKCTEMFFFSIAASSWDLSAQAIAAQNGAAAAAANDRKAYYLKKFEEGKNIRINPNPSLKRYLQAQAGAGGTVPESMSCDDVWKNVAGYVSNYAKKITNQILAIATGDGGDRNRACQLVTEKLLVPGAAGAGACNVAQLENLVSLFILKNSVAKRAPIARFAQRIANEAAVNTPVAEGAMVGLNMGSAGTNPTRSQGNPFGSNLRDPSLLADPENDTRSRYLLIPDPSNKEGLAKWIPAARLSNIGGSSDAAFTDLPRYNIRSMRQQLFTWALHLPYWGGVILYLLAVAYPFLALIVLIPGRAMSFMNLPMAWLWVKSWDIGYAFVMVFERVLWNIFPTAGIAKNFAEKNLAQQNLYDVVAATQQFDQTWNLHMYYMLLSMATLSIPAVTGYATLKSKRAILASFTDKLLADSRSAGQLAAGQYQIQVAGERSRMMTDLGGIAMRSVGPAGQGFSGDGKGHGDNRGQSAMTIAALAGFAKFSKEANLMNEAFGANGKIRAGQAPGAGLNKALKGALHLPQAVASGISAGMDTYGKIVDAEVKHDRQWEASFGTFGRFGQMQKMNDAYGAAMDGSGGYEIVNRDTNPVDAFIEMFTTKVDTVAQNSGDIATSYILATGNLGGALGTFDAAIVTADAIGLRRLAADNPDVTDALMSGIQSLNVPGAAALRESLPTFGFDSWARGEDRDSAASVFLRNVLNLTPEAYQTMRRDPKGDEERFRDSEAAPDFAQRFLDPFRPENARNFGLPAFLTEPMEFKEEGDRFEIGRVNQYIATGIAHPLETFYRQWDDMRKEEHAAEVRWLGREGFVVPLEPERITQEWQPYWYGQNSDSGKMEVGPNRAYEPTGASADPYSGLNTLSIEELRSIASFNGVPDARELSREEAIDQLKQRNVAGPD